MKLRVFAGLLVALTVLTGCRTAYYSTMEKFGVHKRDILKKEVVAARNEQQAASEQFKDALTRIREMYNFQGGDLEKAYDALKRDYDRSASRADAVRERIKDVETVARDLFNEWEKEIQEISTPNLRQNSKDKLRDTRQRYDEMIAALKRAESSMNPVLTRFKDHVLYLKHNLNAAAIASLKGESMDIQTEINKLLQDMNRAIAEADKFIQAMQ
jgi:sugar-specific transcriptional regulator TrmB